MGVWIETYKASRMQASECVTPLVGVWIETQFYTVLRLLIWSLPSWECGLKLGYARGKVGSLGHSPRGSVD